MSKPYTYRDDKWEASQYRTFIRNQSVYVYGEYWRMVFERYLEERKELYIMSKLCTPPEEVAEYVFRRKENE